MDLLNSAQKVLVGGVNSPVRAFLAVGGKPLLMARGRGFRLYDIQGRSYADYCLSWGALILGHDNREVRKAIQKALKNGTSFGTTTKAEIEIARFICRHVPSIDRVRFVNSGTEATMSAVRLARGFTKRAKIIKFDGCYHGHSDDLLSKAGSGLAFLPASSSQGIPQAHMQDTLSLPFNDIQTLSKTIERHHRDIACVIIEPVPGNMGLVNPHKEFLQGLRALTKKYGIILIFDEVMSGFRSNLGCAQSELSIIPDLTCLGKIIGGGFPVGAYGGRKDIMRHLAPLGGVYQAGTFSGNPVVMQAGLAVLHQLTPPAYKKLNDLSRNFVIQTNALLQANGIQAHLAYHHSMVCLRFSSGPVNNYAQALKASDQKQYARLFHYLLGKGIYWPPAELETFFVSMAHSAKELNYLSGQIAGFFLK